MSPLQAPTDVFTVRETDLLSRPPALTSGLFGGVKGALRIPSLSFQYPRRPGCTAKLLCFLTRGGFESHLVHQIPNDLTLFHRLKSKDYGLSCQTTTQLLRLSGWFASRSEEHTSELQSPCNIVCR